MAIGLTCSLPSSNGAGAFARFSQGEGCCWCLRKRSEGKPGFGLWIVVDGGFVALTRFEWNSGSGTVRAAALVRLVCVAAYEVWGFEELRVLEIAHAWL